MPTVGTVGTVIQELRANTGQYTRAMKGARLTGDLWNKTAAKGVKVSTALSTSFKSLDRDIKLATADFKAGTLSANGYATALSVARQQAIGLRGSTTLNALQLTQFNRVLRATQPAAVKAGAGLGTIRSAGASLTARLVGLNGTLGTFASGLGQFAIGNLATIGVIGGLAAVVAGFRKITSRAREAAQGVRDLRERLVEQSAREPTKAATLVGQESNLVIIRQQQRDLRAELAKLQATETVTSLSGASSITRPVGSPKEIREVTTALREQNLAFQNTVLNIRDLREELGLMPRFDLSAFLTQGASVVGGGDKGGFGALGERARVLRDERRALTQRNRDTIRTGFVRLPDFKNIAKIPIQQITAQFDPLREQLRQVGVQSVRALLDGFLGGFKNRSFGELLANAAKGFISTFLTGGITKLLGIASPSKVARGWGQAVTQGFGLGLLDTPRLNLNPMLGMAKTSVAGSAVDGITGSAVGNATNITLDVSGMPTAQTPMAAARDRDWMNFLRESNRALRANGAV